MKYTPGPWYEANSSVRARHDVYTFTTVCQCMHGMKTGEEVRANARLIAAAPDLLAVLKAIAAIDDGDDPALWQYAELFESARAAIAKATGADEWRAGCTESE